MKKKLLRYLICPSCRSDLKLNAAAVEGDEIMEGDLVCQAGCAVYPVVRGVPRMLNGQKDRIAELTCKNFSYSWSKVWDFGSADEIEFYSYFSGILEKGYFKDKVILDAGCGNGRLTYFSAINGAKEVIGFDLSDSVDAAFRNTRHLSNVHIVQANIYKLPFKRGFDFVYSIGVLHHLPKPKDGFAKLTEMISRKGSIFAWVYGKEGNEFYLKLFEPFRKITCRLPPLINKWAAFLLALIIWGIIKLIYLPLSKTGLAAKMPLSEYLLFFHKLGFAQFRATIFDKMIPPISNYYSRDEFLQWFNDSGLKNITISPRNNNSWRGIGSVD